MRLREGAHGFVRMKVRFHKSMRAFLLLLVLAMFIVCAVSTNNDTVQKREDLKHWRVAQLQDFLIARGMRKVAETAAEKAGQLMCADVRHTLTAH